MPPFKPMKLRHYLKWIETYGWRLEKGSIDWKVLDKNGNIVILNVLVTHPAKEVPAICVKKTEKAIKLLEDQSDDG